MSAENVEIIRRMYDAWARRDYETAREALHLEIEWHGPPEGPDPAVFHGHAGVDDTMSDWMRSWNDYRFDVEELIDAGDKVLAAGRQSGRGKESQVDVSSDMFNVWTMRDGKAIEQRMFYDRDNAFRAAGLTE